MDQNKKAKQDPYYFSDPKRWFESETTELIDRNGPHVIEWIDDNDGCGPRRLSKPIMCF